MISILEIMGLVVAVISLIIVIYLIIGGWLSNNEPEPLDWLFIWPIMLWRERIRKNDL